MLSKAVLAAVLLAAAELVSGHAAIISATGDAGGSGMALGIDTATPRDGTRRDPFQQDSTRFRGDLAASVGETLGGGNNNVQSGTQAIMAETGDQLPQVSAGGKLSMTLHQVNADGGGPYTCSVNSDGSGQTWDPIQVTTSPPGENSRNRAGAQTDFPMVAAIPASQQCSGTVAGQDNVCLARCQNQARAGPFGGIVPFQLAGAGGNSTKPAVSAGVARRNLARAILRRESLLRKVLKRQELDDEEEEGEE